MDDAAQEGRGYELKIELRLIAEWAKQISQR
jgi:hypothetical protein